MSITRLPTKICPECRTPLTNHEYRREHMDTFLGEDSTRTTIERSCDVCGWYLLATLTQGDHKTMSQGEQLQLVT